MNVGRAKTVMGLSALLGLGFLVADAAPAAAHGKKVYPRYHRGVRHDLDRDGIKNWNDRDIDGDGVHNRYDRYDYRRTPWGYRRTRANRIPVWKDRDRDGMPNWKDRDIDGDGRRNYRDHDKDGDGRKNRYDDHPKHPRKR